MKTTRIFLVCMLMGLLVAGCSQEQDLAAPGSGRDAGTKNGTEVLGPPSITIAAGTGFAEAGVGMANVTSGQLTVDVPEEAQVVQALLYWAGGTNVGAGDAVCEGHCGAVAEAAGGDGGSGVLHAGNQRAVDGI